MEYFTDDITVKVYKHTYKNNYETGYFGNSYLGVHGHHYVIFLKNTK